MENLNPYNKESFYKEFIKTHTYSLLKENNDRIYFDKFFESAWRGPTPRQAFGERRVSAVPWYYLNYLDTTDIVIDLGCGRNFFKPYFKNLIGIDIKHSEDNFFADIEDAFNDDYVQKNKNNFYAIFSINSIHFRPIEQLKNLCIDFCSLLKDGGRGFLAINTARMLEHSPNFHLQGQDLDRYIRDQFNDFPYTIIVFDIDVSESDAWLDGNIRIVFEK